MISGIARVQGFDISYWRTPKEGPSVVLCHGIGDNGRCWAPLIRVLERDFDVISFDARGHGTSGGPKQGYTPLHYAKDLHAVLQRERVSKPILVGHSVGALACLIYACKHPGCPRALVLEDPQPLSRPPTDEFLRVVISLKAHPVDDLVALVRKRNPNWSTEDIANWATASRQVSSSIQNLGPVEEIEWEDVLRCLSCPVLLIVGAKVNGGNFSEADISAFQQLLPQTQVKVIAEAGHNVRRDSFDAFVTELTEFLQDVTREEDPEIKV